MNEGVRNSTWSLAQDAQLLSIFTFDCSLSLVEVLCSLTIPPLVDRLTYSDTAFYSMTLDSISFLYSSNLFTSFIFGRNPITLYEPDKIQLEISFQCYQEPQTKKWICVPSLFSHYSHTSCWSSNLLGSPNLDIASGLQIDRGNRALWAKVFGQRRRL